MKPLYFDRTLNNHSRDRLLRSAELCWNNRACAQYPETWEHRMWLCLLFWAAAGEAG